MKDPTAESVARAIVLNNITNIRRPHTDPATIHLMDEIKGAITAAHHAGFREGLEKAAWAVEEVKTVSALTMPSDKRYGEYFIKRIRALSEEETVK
jgi:hypothetical protein